MQRRLIPTFEELLEPLPVLSPKRWYYVILSLLVRSIGTYSDGIRIAYENGFDSGIIMNYIYNNSPSGRYYIGKILDKAFLDQVTCKAFRSIKEIQKSMIKSFLEEKNGNPTYVVDLASGKADYIYEVLRETNSNVKVLLRDIDERALSGSFGIAESLNMEDKVSFEKADSLDTESLKGINPRPNLVIEVGLYGIIHDDDLIKTHLTHIKEILNPDAILFNVQTYNPQIEFIARVFKNRSGERCVWHLRPAEHLIRWAEDAGFRNPEITMDPYGIYAVVMMRNCS